MGPSSRIMSHKASPWFGGRRGIGHLKNCWFNTRTYNTTGISMRAVANELLYDNIYQERYMGLPQEKQGKDLCQTGSHPWPMQKGKTFRGNYPGRTPAPGTTIVPLPGHGKCYQRTVKVWTNSPRMVYFQQDACPHREGGRADLPALSHLFHGLITNNTYVPRRSGIAAARRP